MTLVFTICSNNYLAQAKALGDSLLQHNPDYEFIIALVDQRSDLVDYDFFEPYQIIPIAEIPIIGFNEMYETYNITELNTAVKPYIFHHFFNTYPSAHNIIYLDPDIFVYDRFRVLEEAFSAHNIILTPHFFTPIYDKFRLNEPDILNAGLYNLGFLGLKRSADTDTLLHWWMIKLKDQCVIDFKNGLFVDQLWMNFAPLYFQNVHVLKHLGYNMAYWNLHERELQEAGEHYVVNNKFPLVFYHFSGYNFTKPEEISKYQDRYTFDQRDDIHKLFMNYKQIVLENRFETLSAIRCYYMDNKNQLKEAQTARIAGSTYTIRRVGQYLKRKIREKIKG